MTIRTMNQKPRRKVELRYENKLCIKRNAKKIIQNLTRAKVLKTKIPYNTIKNLIKQLEYFMIGEQE
jgi:hypothetical protein